MRFRFAVIQSLLLTIAITTIANNGFAQLANPKLSQNVTNLREGALPQSHFVNPIAEGADPWVIRDPNADRYLWCLSDGNRAIAIHAGKHLTSLGPKHIVWNAPKSGPVSREVWAPELHFLQGRWHIYFAASNGKNENHLAYVLRSKSRDPLGAYELHEPFATGTGANGRSPNIWAIDMTILEHNEQLFAIWSGWDEPKSDRQFLYIAPMKSPIELAGPRVRLCPNNSFPWEFTENKGKGRGLNEAPQVIQRAGRTFVTYSCGASWLPTYKLGMLELTGADPLAPESWTKFKQPVFTTQEPVFGVGHSSIVPSLNGSEWWHVYHAKRDRSPGWRRAIFVQPMQFGKKGLPQFGKPIAPNTPLLRPNAPPTAQPNLPFSSSLKSTGSLESLSFYGHHQFFDVDEQGLHLGRVPNAPINTYRSGEKAVLNSTISGDFSTEVTIDFSGDNSARDAGILFRTTAASVGFDAQRGYFAGLIPKTQLVILGKTDGSNWQELSRSQTDIDADQPQRLRVTVEDGKFTVTHNGSEKINFTDSTYTTGSVGLRVVNTHAIFSNLRVEALP